MIVFGTRGSELALTQTRRTAQRLQQLTGEAFELVIIETRGDLDTMRPLPELGGKGVFTAELEQALRSGRIDAAVHSLKDLPVDDPPGLVVGAIPERVAAHDVLLIADAAHAPSAAELPLRKGARVGTSSPRRAGVLRRLRPDLELVDIRGNVPTRVDKVRRGEYDACVLAAAGLDRLDLDLAGVVSFGLPMLTSPPAPGQGALAVQCRADDARVRGLLARMHDPLVAGRVDAERDILRELGGGCSMPLGAFAERAEDGKWVIWSGLFARGARVGGVFRLAVGDDGAALVGEIVAHFAPLASEPLRARRIVLLRPRATEAHSPQNNPDHLREYLATAGADVIDVALTRIEPLPVPQERLATLASVAHVLAFTSARAVHAYYAARDAEAMTVAPRRVFAVGAATQSALASHGIESIVPDDPAGGERLAEAMLASGLERDVRIVMPCAEDCHPAFERRLRAAHRTVETLPLYRIVPCTERVETSLFTDGVDAIVVTSPSGARALSQHFAGGLPPLPLIAIGTSTAAALPGAFVARHTTPEAVLAAVLEALPS